MKTEISNRDLASDIIKGKRKQFVAPNLKQATAIRVAGHRLGHVLSVTKDGSKFEITKAGSKVSHRPKPVTKVKPAKKAAGKVLKKAA